MKNLVTVSLLLVSSALVRIACPGKAVCGKRPLFPQPSTYRIIGGRHTLAGEVPWQVFIRYSDGIGFSLCGGSIIHQRWILTAAHCVHKLTSENISVVTGIINLTDDKEHIQNKHKQVHRVAKMIINKFSDHNWVNDIALLELATPIRYDEYSQPICLAHTNDKFARGVCTASGWGIIDKITKMESQVLKAVNLPIIPLNDCRNLSRKEWKVVVGRNFICTLFPSGEKDACGGDSGGPLVCLRNDGHYEQVGIVSWGFDCAKKQIPGLYTSVSHYFSWISENTGLDFK